MHSRYYPLVWMFHSRELNNRVNNIHERAVRIAFRDYESTFQQLIVKVRYVCIYRSKKPTNTCYRDFETKNDSKPVIMKDVFKFKNWTILTIYCRNMETLNRSNVNSVKYGVPYLNNHFLRFQNLENFAKWLQRANILINV